MGDRIFFNDGCLLRGPFTERQVQEWYREQWLENSFTFYFTQSDEQPSNLENNWTLGSLRSRNGFGCPFINFDDNKKRVFEKKREEREKRLECIEKEIADLKKNCAAILSLDDNIKRAKKQFEGLLHNSGEVTAQQSTTGVPIEPMSVERMERSFEEIGNAVATFILDAFAVYATGEFANWQKDRGIQIESSLNEVKKEEERKARNLVCEQILIEKMKEKDFFCCALCQEALFNYKQALVHFTSMEHYQKETKAVKQSGIARVRGILDSFTKLPAILTKKDESIEQNRFKTNGRFFENRRFGLRPDGDFIYDFCVKYAFLLCTDSIATNDVFTGKIRFAMSCASMLVATEIAVGNTKGSVGREAMDILHNHIGQGASTYCIFCGFKTGDREGFYAHLISSVHMKAVGKDTMRFDILTLLVNIHRRDLI